MARIDTIVAGVGLQPGSTPTTQLSTADTRATQELGGAVQDVASSFIQRLEQKENFRADNDYRKLKLDLQADMEARAAEMPEGGDGFHDTFISEVYRPKRDEFLSKVPERLRPQFETVLADESGADFTSWSIAAATKERDESYRWYKQEIGLTHEQLATAIAMSPEAYDDLLADGKAIIETSGLPTPEKAQLELQWEGIAQTAILNQMMADDPQGVLRELGVDARELSPTTQFDIISRAVQWKESRDNPNARSGKGAVGLMQVMPATAREIAAELGDENFPAGENDTVIGQYLTNPFVNKRYGEAYLRKQLRTFANTRNPIETALVAYNAGPSTAQKWVESGYDDSLLAKETRDYKDSILSTLQAPAAGDPTKVKFEGESLEGVSQDLQTRVATAFSSLGRDKVKVNSGYRSEEHNKKVGGAEDSQHIHGSAMDIDVTGMSRAERVELIRALSAAGVTGIGVYENGAIHADLAGRRAWGPDYSAESVPAWAAGVIAEHLNGTVAPSRKVSTRYGTMAYDQRQKFIQAADQAITSRHSAVAKSSSAEKVEVRRARDNELALIRSTGQGAEGFDETNVSTILGEDDYSKFIYERDIAQRTFTATSDIATMPTEDLEQRFLDYTPTPGADFAAQQQIQAAVQKEIDRVTNLRTKQPDKAALIFPEVKQAYDTLQTELLQGDAEPASVQAFVRMMLEKQADFGTAPEARAPIPSEWATEIGRAMTRVPEPAGRNVEDIKAAIQVQYTELQKYFGDYTDEVLVYAISEYKGLSKNTAETITAYMTAIQAGGDPFKLRPIDSAVDADQVESFNWAPRTFYGMPGGLFDQLANPIAPEDEDVLSPEERLRAVEEEE